MGGLLRHDFLHGLLKRWKLFLIVPVVMLAFSVHVHQTIANGHMEGWNNAAGTWMDYMLNAFEGMEAFHMTAEAFFIVPIGWFTFYIGLAYVVGYYAEQDLKTRGVYTLMAARSKIRWWMSKCIWCLVCVVLYFLLAWLTVAIYTVVSDWSLSIDVTRDIASVINAGAVLLKQNQLQVLVLLLPPVMAMGISMVQMLFSIILGSVESFMIVCCMYVLSAYYMNPLLIGNYTMWCRCDTIEKYSGVDPVIGFFIAGLLLVGSMLIGIFYIEKYDLMKDEPNY